jgi:hypothetical protein
MASVLETEKKTSYSLLFEQPDTKEKTEWKLILVNNDTEDRTDVVNIKLLPSSLTNKFQAVATFFEEISQLMPNFVYWYSAMLKKYIKSGYNSEIILEETPNMIDFATKYVDSKNVDFSSFIDYKKVSKTSIVFDENDIRELHIASTCLKIEAIFCYDEVLKLTENVQKLVYNEFIKNCCEIGTTEKIYQMVHSKTYRSTITDRYMWEVIKMGVIETPQSYTLVMFNFLMKNLLSILDVTVNPVPFFVGVMTDSIRYMMISIYKDKIVYGEPFGSSGDIYGSSVNKDTLNVLCCNDVIESAARVGVEILEQEYGIVDDKFLEVRDSLDTLTRISATMKCVILPIASKVLDIPYTYLLKASPKHIMLMGVLLYYCSKNIMDVRFPVLTEFLVGCPKKRDTEIVRSSYKIKNPNDIINDNVNKVFGINSITLRYKIASSVCGILIASKRDLKSIITGCEIPKINYSDLEMDTILFYSEYYSGRLDPMFEKMKEKVNTFF